MEEILRVLRHTWQVELRITSYVVSFLSSLRPESNDMTITAIYCEISKAILT